MTGTATPPSNNDSPGSKPLPTRKRASDATPEDKPKRTRTGCLTCRERHLKCDESKPTCHNCLKSQRECNWGKKLNFLDTTCEKNAYIIPQGIDYQVAFMDESRTIASEYVGGREMYPVEDVDSHSHLSVANNGFDMGPPAASRQHIPQIQGIAQESYQQAQINYNFDQQRTQQQQQQHARSSKLIPTHMQCFADPTSVQLLKRPHTILLHNGTLGEPRGHAKA
ncbi:C6 zinc finger domain containing protein [Pyrenophora tritici-repentis]|nr:C6 zinc finger domain containing protein [Pyrenophora tritici-repentis]KAI1600696.1 C6 zinc finger domain containing protein [Pyrenophora tritici-repentis]